MTSTKVGDYALGLLSRLHEHDAPTHDHCRSVGVWSGLLAKALKLSKAEIKLAVLAGTLHDIGKALTPVEILRKEGPLSGEEWDVMRRHAGDGASILEAIPGLGACAAIVRSHHEDFDGRGYPDGLAGQRIPALARIVAVSDSFHAMITTRPYRPAATVASALDALRGGRGGRWDETAVDAMVALVGAKTQRATGFGATVSAS